MSNRRMFSKNIISSAAFIKMPASCQSLYFHLALNADDDGIVEAFSIMRMILAGDDDLRILEAKKFVTILNDDLVTFINDWLEHNLIRPDRKVDSKYKDLLLQVFGNIKIIDSKKRTDRVKSNELGRPIAVPEPSHDGEMSAQDSIGKDRLEKHICANKKNIESSEEFENAWALYPTRHGANSRIAACKCWNARIKEGVKAEDLILATKNYQIMMTNNGNIGTAYIMQAQRFYGVNREYEQFINLKQEELKNATNQRLSYRDQKQADRDAVAKRIRDDYNKAWGIAED
jgi:hypothetical protein